MLATVSDWSWSVLNPTSLWPPHTQSALSSGSKKYFFLLPFYNFFKLSTVFDSKAASGTNLESGQGNALSVQVFIRFWLYGEFPITHRNNPPLQSSATTPPWTPPHLRINEHFIRRVGGTKPDFVPFLNSKSFRHQFLKNLSPRDRVHCLNFALLNWNIVGAHLLKFIILQNPPL